MSELMKVFSGPVSRGPHTYRGNAYPHRRKFKGEFVFNRRHYYLGLFLNEKSASDAVKARKRELIAELGGVVKPGPKPRSCN